MFCESLSLQLANVFCALKKRQHLTPMQFAIEMFGENHRKRRVNAEETCSQGSVMPAVHVDGSKTRHTRCQSTHFRVEKYIVRKC